MREVAHELQGIRKVQEEAMEAQRQGFQVELERVTEELELMKLRSVTLEREIEALRTEKSTQKQSFIQKKPVAKDATMTGGDKPKVIDEIRNSESPRNSRGQADMSTTPASANLSTNIHIERRDYALL